MSATVYYEPYKFPAGVLALVVHSMFFALLYFGFNWNRQPFSTPTMSVELWPSLPEEAVASPPKVEEAVPPPPPQKKIVEPDIVMPDKKKIETKPVETKPEKKKPVPQPVERAKPKPVTPKPAVQNPEARRIADEQASLQQAEQARQDEQAAAIGRVVDEYKGKIQRKIRKAVRNPLGVADDAHAEFLVTLLPDGSVLKAELKKSSGNAAYDDAVEHAIWKSVPLPLPPDVQLFSKFREILMTFKPEKEKPTE
jgi:colicin import membrane protein